MMRFGGINIILAWVFFGILLAVLAWLLLRSGRNDSLSPVVRPQRCSSAPQAGKPWLRDPASPQPAPLAVSEGGLAVSEGGLAVSEGAQDGSLPDRTAF
jgi:hypothetical protein